MQSSQTELLKTRRFLPLFVTQFLGALNDNLFKNALVILILFQAANEAEGQVLVTAAAGIFIVPFFLFSATAGLIADKYEKARLIRQIKIAEILIMCLAAFGLLLDASHVTLKIYALLAVLGLMGIQSAFFGPLKYAILPDHLKPEELIGGNALVEAATFLAILIGLATVLRRLESHLGVETGGTTVDGRVHLGREECLGACANAPMMRVDETYHEDLDLEKVKAILDGLD